MVLSHIDIEPTASHKTPLIRCRPSTGEASAMGREDRRHGTYRFTSDWNRSSQRTYDFAMERPDLQLKTNRR